MSRPGRQADRTERRPFYVRALRLRHVRPGSLACFLLFEGMISLAVLLALAELISWWSVPIPPLAVAAMAKINDVVVGLSRPAERRSAGQRVAGRKVVNRGLGQRLTDLPDQESRQRPGNRAGCAEDAWPADRAGCAEAAPWPGATGRARVPRRSQPTAVARRGADGAPAPDEVRPMRLGRHPNERRFERPA